MAFEETSTIRESLKRLLNKQIVGISETDDYENRKILGFSFHTVKRTEHVTIGQPIRDLFPQVYDNFITLNAAVNDHIFVHPGKRIVNIQDQNKKILMELHKI
uniref:Uncharacterized protein n=1 Tax=Panagrolaimus davidi TaxID=227884 RepID=A0A914PIB6_9BILA